MTRNKIRATTGCMELTNKGKGSLNVGETWIKLSESLIVDGK